MGEIKRIENIAVDKLIPYVNNAKVHSEDQVTRIASSIREFGFLSPVLVDKDYNIIAGHGRVMAAKKLGLSDVPCVYIEGLSEAQRKAYILADNRLGELADWDMDLVKLELEELELANFDIDLTGFDINDFLKPNEIVEVDVPDLPETPKAKVGDIYELGGGTQVDLWRCYAFSRCPEIDKRT
ncbi:MAG: ParB N-terminal domain-containing protein [Clostridiales bacterium]|nr:ParB N-terminal domain-containing protein [Clostridiales bacterium]